MNSLLNFISVASAFLFGVGAIYWVLDVTIGKLQIIHSKFEWCGLQIKDFVFIAFSTILLLSMVSFVRPY